MLTKIPPWALHFLAVTLAILGSVVVLSVLQAVLAFQFAAWVNFSVIALIVSGVTSELPSNYRGKQPLPLPTTT